MSGTVVAAEVIADRYKVGAVLGVGGMATVYAAVDDRLGREVAVKVLRPALFADTSLRHRFEVEARTAARLSHPNVVAVYDTGEDDEAAFIVMERLPGRTLADEIRQGPLSVERTVAVGAQVLAALSAAHRAGIVHRDVKPSNVLTCDDGSVKVADFGIATTSDGTSNLTATGLLMGTPAYLAPERLDGSSATFSSDLYSVGALLYESLSGRKPFEADSAIALIAVIRERPIVPLATLRPHIPLEVARAVERALEKDPAQRFSSAQTMAEEIVRAGERVDPAQDTGVIEPQRDRDLTETRPLERTRVFRATPDRTSIAPVAPSIPMPEARPRRRRLWLVVVIAMMALAVGVLAVVSPGGTPSTPTTTLSSTPSPSTSTSVPAPLQHSLDNLGRAVGQ